MILLLNTTSHIHYIISYIHYIISYTANHIKLFTHHTKYSLHCVKDNILYNCKINYISHIVYHRITYKLTQLCGCSAYRIHRNINGQLDFTVFILTFHTISIGLYYSRNKSTEIEIYILRFIRHFNTLYALLFHLLMPWIHFDALDSELISIHFP